MGLPARDNKRSQLCLDHVDLRSAVSFNRNRVASLDLFCKTLSVFRRSGFIRACVLRAIGPLTTLVIAWSQCYWSVEHLIFFDCTCIGMRAAILSASLGTSYNAGPYWGSCNHFFFFFLILPGMLFLIWSHCVPGPRRRSSTRWILAEIVLLFV